MAQVTAVTIQLSTKFKRFPNTERVTDNHTGNAMSTFFRIVCGIFDVPHKSCEPVIAFGDTITKAALSPQLLKDRVCWSSRGFEPITFHAIVLLAIN